MARKGRGREGREELPGRDGLACRRRYLLSELQVKLIRLLFASEGSTTSEGNASGATFLYVFEGQRSETTNPSEQVSRGAGGVRARNCLSFQGPDSITSPNDGIWSSNSRFVIPSPNSYLQTKHKCFTVPIYCMCY